MWSWQDGSEDEPPTKRRRRQLTSEELSQAIADATPDIPEPDKRPE